MSAVGDPTTWSHSPVKISPHTFSAIEIAVAIGVSVFGAAWGISITGSSLIGAAIKAPLITSKNRISSHVHPLGAPIRSIMGSRHFITPLHFGLLCCLILHPAQAAVQADGYTINGRVKIPSAVAGFGILGKISDVKVVLNGGQRVTFLRHDGYFSFHGVPAGTHLIEVTAIGYFFSPVRVDVSARNPGKVQAALTENRRPLNELVLEPLREEQYYEIREPFSIMSIVKSPMGLMVGFMLIVVFLMPKLMENMDPEEMRRAQEEMRSQGVPSLSSFLPGAARN